MRTIKLMPDYQCFPLWEIYTGKAGHNVDPADLPISAELCSELVEWGLKFDSTLNLREPEKSGFADKGFWDDFKKTGFELLNRLKKEIGSEFNVIHHF